MPGRGFNPAPQQSDNDLQWATISRSRNTASSMLQASSEARAALQNRNHSNGENRAPNRPPYGIGPCGVRLGQSVFAMDPSDTPVKYNSGGFEHFIKPAPSRNNSSQNVGIAVPPPYEQNRGSVFNTAGTTGHNPAGAPNLTRPKGGFAKPSTSGHSVSSGGFGIQSSQPIPSEPPRQLPPGYFPEGYTGQPVPPPRPFDANRDPITDEPLFHGRRMQGYHFDVSARQPMRPSSSREAAAPSPPTNGGSFSAPSQFNTFRLERCVISGRQIDPATGKPYDDACSADQERMDRYDFVENNIRKNVTGGSGRGGGRGRGRGNRRGGGNGAQRGRRSEGNNHHYHREPRFMKKEGTAPGEEGGMWTYLRETAAAKAAEKAAEADPSSPKLPSESAGKTPLPLSKKTPKPKVRKIPKSTLKIAALLRAHSQGKQFENLVDRAVIENAEDFSRQCAESHVILDESKDCLSLTEMNLIFPPGLQNRNGLQMYRPVIVDGCALAFSFNDQFASLWQGPTRTSAFHKKRVLPMMPLVQTALQFVLNGHKVTIVLPAFYEEPTIKSQQICKVDDLEAFNTLLQLGLLQFVDPKAETDLHSTIKEVCREVHGCYFSHQDMRCAYRLEEEGEESLLVENEVDKQKIMIAEENSDERVMSVTFCGPQRKLLIARNYAIYAGTSKDRMKDQYYSIGMETVFYYTEKDGDEHDYAKRLEQQLTFTDQIKQIVVLARLCDLSTQTVRIVQLFLLVARMNAVHLDQIEEFVESCPVVEESEPKKVAATVDDLVMHLGGCTVEASEIEEQVVVVDPEPLVNFEMDPEIAIPQLTFLPPLVPTTAPTAPPPEEPPVSVDDFMPPTEPTDSFNISMDLDLDNGVTE